MNAYGWLLVGQTILALLALGLCGGWVLWPFRRDERPYLWLATPLAGLFAFGGGMAALYFFGRLPFRWCLWVSFGVNALATLACLFRGRPSLPSPWSITLATLVTLAAAYWATLSCNKTAIEAREPTIASLDGSDMYGYAIVADWLRRYSVSEAPHADQPFEVFQYVNLKVDGSRPVTFLLLAGAAEVRDTSGLFSYDWASGVILAAGVLGLGGLFGVNELFLVLLVAGGASTNWLANARTGFMGKSVAYPGAILLASLFLSTLTAPTRERVARVIALGFALGFSLNPIFPVALLGVVLGCHAVAMAVVFGINSWREWRFPLGRDFLRPLAGAVLLASLTVLPAFVLHRQVYTFMEPPAPPPLWPFVIRVSLDLDIPHTPLVSEAMQAKLLVGCFAILAVAMALAVRRRHTLAVTLLSVALLVPVAWLSGEYRLIAFHGLIYPLTLAGAAVLAEGAGGRRRDRARIALVALLMVYGVGLRLPQVRVSADRYVISPYSPRSVVRQSDVEAMRAAVGNEAVDMPVGHYADNHVVIGELATRGVPVQFRAPAWERSLKDWAGLAQCPAPDLLLPKARYTLLEKNTYSPPETVRWVGSRLKLVEDREAVGVLGVEGSQDMVWDREWRPVVWIGNAPTTFLIHNGTGREQSMRLLGDTCAGPSHPNRDRRTLCYKLNDQAGKQSLPKESKAAIPLRLAPGLNRVEVRIEEAADPPLPPRHPVALLSFCHWRLESSEPAER